MTPWYIHGHFDLPPLGGHPSDVMVPGSHGRPALGEQTAPDAGCSTATTSSIRVCKGVLSLLFSSRVYLDCLSR